MYFTSWSCSVTRRFYAHNIPISQTHGYNMRTRVYDDGAAITIHVAYTACYPPAISYNTRNNNHNNIIITYLYCIIPCYHNARTTTYTVAARRRCRHTELSCLFSRRQRTARLCGGPVDGNRAQHTARSLFTRRFYVIRAL